MKKILGNTKIKISAIGLGTGHFFWDSDLEHDKKIELIRLAIKSGINFIDTAEEYGQGASEIMVGEAIHDIREKVIVASKFSPQHHNCADVLRSCKKSLNRLKTEYIDIYQIHWPNPAIPLKDTIEALKILYREGKIHSIGISNYSLEEIKRINKTRSNNKKLIIHNKVVISSDNIFRKKHDILHFPVIFMK